MPIYRVDDDLVHQAGAQAFIIEIRTDRLAGAVMPPYSVRWGWTRSNLAGARRWRHDGPMTERYEYKVVELREKLLGGKMSGAKLESIRNEHAAQGWQLRAITAAEVKGRIGPGGVDGILITFERRAG